MSKASFQLSSRLPAFVLILCILQPLLDVLSFWTQELSWGSYLTLSLRFLMLVSVVLTAFLITGERKPYYVCIAICAAFYLCHVGACTYADSAFLQTALFKDFTNYIRVIQIPFFTLAFITFLRSSEQVKAALAHGLTAVFLIFAAIVVISVVTHTALFTYANKSIGIMGWVTAGNGNVQSAILSSLFPLVLCSALKSRHWWHTVLISVCGCAMLYFLATRLAYFSIFITIAGTLFVWAVCRKLTFRNAGILLVCMLLCGATYRISPVVKNQSEVAANAAKKQENINQLVEQGISEYGTDSPDYLCYAYQYYLPDLVARFGLERVADQYQASTDVSSVASVRAMKLNYCRLLLEDRPIWSVLFGLSYGDMEYNGHIYDVENDFHGILYLYGYVGFICFMLFLGIFPVRILIVLIRDAKTYFTAEAGSLGISLFLCLVHAYMTMGVLRRPNASFYLSLVLAWIWFLTIIPKRSETALQE